MNEFELIRNYFCAPPGRKDVAVGVGDDGAVLNPPPGQQLVVSTDTLVAGVHFPADTDPYSIGWKSLAVNLSDLAAMGSTPAWFTLNLTLPSVDPDWLKQFSAGMFALARLHNTELVGGDTTRGPLSITMTVHGFVPQGAALLRKGARLGDRIYVTGTLGDAGIGLRCIQGKLALEEESMRFAIARLERPAPRVSQGEKLRAIASACIDISDGLVADLGHVLEQSGVGARVDVSTLPLSSAYRSAFAPAVDFDIALANGDDYELCFTLSPSQVAKLEELSADFGCTFSHIGVIEAEPGLRLSGEDGAPYTPRSGGYDHFR